MEIRILSSSEEIPEIDHVLVVKLDSQRFEVSGTAACESANAAYLRPIQFDRPSDALRHAEEFASTHALPMIFVKGFQPRAGL